MNADKLQKIGYYHVPVYFELIVSTLNNLLLNRIGVIPDLADNLLQHTTADSALMEHKDTETQRNLFMEDKTLCLCVFVFS